MEKSLVIVVALLMIGTLVHTSSACKDLFPPGYCIYQKSIGSCRMGGVRSLCKKTCGDCGVGVVTLPPRTNGPVITRPIPTAPPQPGTCGVPMSISSRVIAGTLASPGAWPWQIRLLKNGRGGCGGTIVSPNWVVTASHCVSKSPIGKIYQVEVGSTNLNKPERYRQRYSVKRVIMHPQYNSRPLDNDIALVELNLPIQMNSMVQPACLPRNGEQVPVGTNCYITGFGKTRHPGSGSRVMMQAVLPVVSKAECSRLNTAATRIPITDNMICAGHGPSRRESGCHGDSGGPFVCRNSQGGFTLQGAVSWGSATCDTKKSYTVFARVAELKGWIDQYVK